MQIVKVKCIENILQITSNPTIASGGLQENSMEFEFNETWNGFAKTAVFYRNENEVYNVVLDINNKCKIIKMQNDIKE